MTLSLSLNNALSGLNINQQALAVLSQNIANANTAGYSKQVVNQQAVSIAGQGEGVSMDTVTRTVDAYLTTAVQQQNSVVGQTTAMQDYNTQIQQLIGQPGSSNSIDTFIGTFFSNMQALAQTPTSSALQQTAVDSGVTLANQVQSLAQGLQGLQFQADKDVGTDITTVNSDLKNLFQLNGQIVTQTALGQSVADLQDQRDSVINDISQYMNIQTYTTANGAINLTTGNGVPLLDESLYQLNYSGVGSATSFSSNATLSPITVTRLDPDGNPTSDVTTLVAGATPAQTTTSAFTSGKIAASMSMRDQQIPGLMTQLDNLTSNLSTQINNLQNSGSGYPGANSYTGVRSVNAQDYSNWSGNVQIAVLGPTGQPIAAPYASGATSVPPLNIDLSTLNTGNGAGNPSVQGIINEINDYYGVPQNKASLGNLDNIQLASNSPTLAGNPPQLNFDFDLSNLSSTSSNFYVTGVTVKDSSGTTLTPVTSTVPQIALNATNTYTTTASSGNVTVATTGTNNLTNGETVYLTNPPGTVDGIPGADLGGYFTISNVTANSFDITAAGGATATTGMATGVAGQSALPPYDTVAAGDEQRTTGNGTITANLSGNPTSPYYTVTANVAVEDGSGNITTSQISYQVTNATGNLLNNRYGAQSVSGQGTLVTPTSSQPLATAMLVDANGNELPKVNGQYVTTQNGYLEIKAGNSTNTIAIGSLDSSENGKPNNNPPIAGTGQGFSSYFNLNDFFTPNNLTPTGDSVAGSALNLQVQQRLQNDPSQISTGTLTRSATPAGSTVQAYTFERDAGDDSVIQNLANLQNTTIDFAAAGGLSATSQTLTGYAGEVIASSASTSATATTNQTNAQTLLTGYTTQASATSGVNLDTELANTIIYQNAYAASARVITVTNTLFSTLLQSFGS